MQLATRSAVQNAVIYTVVALVLLLVVVLGVRWMTDRSDYYATRDEPSTETVEEAEGVQEQRDQTDSAPTANEEDEQPAANKAPETEETPPVAVGSTGPHTTVPSTGPEDYIAPVVAVSTLAFAATWYLKERRRLANTATQDIS